MTNEVWWRLGCFFSILIIMMLLEWQKPARQAPIKSSTRWFANFGLVFASSVIARLVVPIGLTAVALYNQEHGIGLFNQIALPSSLIIILSILLLDILIYWQHRLFHQVPILWRLHRVHHADAHVDTSTGLRFHPIEIVLSILIKLIAVTALGVPAIAVLIFEIALNGLALFNHANIRLPNAIEKPLRLILMTQILHRIHHSQVVSETNSNYGFSVIWWDKLFGSYKGKAKKTDADINIGLKEYPSQNQNASLLGLLTMPFKNK
ncbi:sterol desaturase family protein [Pseudoalteromonas sp. NZS71]|uniref:sterol desaturase family protein n=1 Tax=unclassified Pseudoalteromonas TaxID=194690 RepID=UPI0015FEE6E8|nr:MULTISPECIES: sterol desaturase family protein [unclassified Pseudoalteromonas]MBB1442111.1 sterol desaturase family protein [Pseudoalteromonas sp. SG43-3]MBH0059695.1 sterol desaturase family protein [Pseudoalteromonas sp. NZS71]